MSYTDALKEAGATIHEYGEFGSYQGDWYALVTWKGETGWIQGSYGSCSGCDAFESEFQYITKESFDYYRKNNKYTKKIERRENKYLKRLAEFGKDYLETMLTQEQAEAYAAKEADWSLEDKEALEWLREHSIAKLKEKEQHHAKETTMTPKEILIKILLNAKSDNLERAFHEFRKMNDEQMNEEYCHSGYTRREILEVYRKEREEWHQAYNLAMSIKE